MHRAICVRAHGGPEQLAFEPVEVAAPGRGEVLLRQTAVGVNFLDVYHRTGLYPLPLPHGIGSEGVGVVEAVGPQVALAVGTRVGHVLAGPPGSYAERVVVPARRLVELPRGIDDATAAALLLKGLTAEYLVRRTFRIGPGHRALVHAAAGGVGLLLCQWLRHLGATVFGTVSTDAKAALAAVHGCHHPVVRGREDFVEVVRSITRGRGVDVVYDSIGRATIAGSLDCLRPRGLLVAFGNASGPPAPLDLLELARRGSLFATRPSLADYTRTRGELRRAAAALFTVVQQGAVRARIDRRLPLREAAAAHRLLEAGATSGAIVLEP